MWLGIGLGKRERAYVAIIVTYDIVRNKRRTKLHWFLRELGINTKKSEFECEVSREELRLLRRYPDARLDMREDSLTHPRLKSPQRDIGRPSIRPRTHSSRGLRSSFCFRPDAPACRSR